MKAKPVWEKSRPKDLGPSKKLTPAKKASAKAEDAEQAAREAGVKLTDKEIAR